MCTFQIDHHDSWNSMIPEHCLLAKLPCFPGGVPNLSGVGEFDEVIPGLFFKDNHEKRPSQR